MPVTLASLTKCCFHSVNPAGVVKQTTLLNFRGLELVPPALAVVWVSALSNVMHAWGRMQYQVGDACMGDDGWGGVCMHEGGWRRVDA